MNDRLPHSHDHVFDAGNPAAERGTRLVMGLTLAAMVVEIVAGLWFNSMALLADGWHMSSHALAIGLSAYAYLTARHHASDARYAFGAWKVEVLAGFASAVFLLGVAGVMVVESVQRLLAPSPIRYREAILVAVLGLAVNLLSARILGGAHHHHGHDHDHAHGHAHGHDDLNLRSAYLHVLADAATSVLAILALLGGMLAGAGWLDPVMGLVGAALVAWWARGLLRDTARVLLDREMDHPVVDEIRAEIAGQTLWSPPPRITDLHVWRVGRDKFAVILALAGDQPGLTPAAVRGLLARHQELAHVTVEINRR